ncbi:XK-related protein 8 [Intoshia linei]|uniref:XK-related protein n=1 Tax=Intoshia linei TaxID=1819745 RepID=A0A177B5R9_9BILA|nr:XK-related protein 8 [Intoshia linei]
MREPEKINKVTLFDVVLTVCSLISFLADIISDLVLAIYYYYLNHKIWFTLTLIFIIVPAIFMQIFSYIWYKHDKSYVKLENMDSSVSLTYRIKHNWIYLISHILLLQPIERYLKSIKTCIKAYKQDDPILCKIFFHQYNDICLLRIFEAFLESSPQTILQFYIIFSSDSNTYLAFVSIVVSLLSIAISVAAYHHSLRQNYDSMYSTRIPSLIFHTLWHFCMVGSRIIMYSIFAVNFRNWVFLLIGIRWLVMQIWIFIEKTDFGKSLAEKVLFDFCVSCIYVFTFFNVSDGPTRYRLTLFYFIVLIENVLVCIALTYFYYTDVMLIYWTYIVFIFALYLIGIAFMLTYYHCFHPKSQSGCNPNSLKHSVLNSTTKDIESIEL